MGRTRPIELPLTERCRSRTCMFLGDIPCPIWTRTTTRTSTPGSSSRELPCTRRSKPTSPAGCRDARPAGGRTGTRRRSPRPGGRPRTPSRTTTRRTAWRSNSGGRPAASPPFSTGSRRPRRTGGWGTRGTGRRGGGWSATAGGRCTSRGVAARRAANTTTTGAIRPRRPSRCRSGFASGRSSGRSFGGRGSGSWRRRRPSLCWRRKRSAFETNPRLRCCARRHKGVLRMLPLQRTAYALHTNQLLLHRRPRL
mmetsp:Transcript_46316/g.140301  ORF Transcript_46316/g.140301 Transcript_46316/m.140301 type:complete len:253 (+) Transcript_46316:406-1164(+)